MPDVIPVNYLLLFHGGYYKISLAPPLGPYVLIGLPDFTGRERIEDWTVQIASMTGYASLEE
jgi:hypothetical protein